MGTTYLDPDASQMGKKESIADTAHVLGRMYDGIEYRGFGQEIVEELSDKAGEVFDMLSAEFNCEFDDAGSIGKRYRRQDEIGTPFCITYDFESETDGAVTVRDRDTMEQVRVPIAELKNYFEDKFRF